MNKCIVCGKLDKGKLYCSKHYTQLKRYGKIFERTIFDKNEISVCGDKCKMVVYKRNIPVAVTTFNKRHISKIKDIKWSINSQNYIMGSKYDKRFFLHSIILPPKPGYIIDHKDRNPLNNLDDNLRYATKSQNAINTHKVKGYFWVSREKRFVAVIIVNGVRHNLGYFRKEKDAIKARREAEVKFFGKFARSA